MQNLTRDSLVKSIVAIEIAKNDFQSGNCYTKHLTELYNKWEHESSESLCKKYNELNSTNLTVNQLKRESR